MRHDRRALFIGLFLTLLAIGTGWLNLTHREDPPRVSRAPHLPDFWVEGFNALTMDAEGRPARRLTASLMRHFEDDGTTELTAPVLLVYEPGLPPWHIRSERGWMSGDGNLLLLQGEVLIDREASERSRPVHLVTRDLRVQPREDYAETDQAVHAESGPHWVTSQGLEAWLRAPVRIKLLAQVRGHYAVGP